MTNFGRVFPKLHVGNYRVTSPYDYTYNCIAWALGDTHNWWWPFRPVGPYYWPPGIANVLTLDAFQAVFALFGYAPGASPDLEDGVEKVAIFADPNGVPQHAARQLASGWWTSKMGAGEDIEHALYDLEGDFYGTVAIILQRPRTVAQATSSIAA